MDELSFRRRIYADPNDNEPDIVTACHQDKQKAKFKADMLEFDKLLSDSLNVEVPDNLSERILLGQSIDFQRKQKRKHRLHLAMAASVAFAIGITFQMVGVSPRYDTLGDHALAHLTAEYDHIPAVATYSQEQLNVKLAHFGGEMVEKLAPIKFANFCDFDGTTSLHIVLQGPKDDVTVFIVPADSGLKSTKHFSDMKYKGETIKTHAADMVIITDKDDSVEKWRKDLQKSIKWQKA